MAEPDWRPPTPGDFTGAANFAALGDRLVDILSPKINFQRFNIGLIDLADHMFVDAYVSGRNVAGRATGHRRTLDGTVVEAKGNEEIEYDGELHTAANLFDALKEGYYGKF